MPKRSFDSSFNSRSSATRRRKKRRLWIFLIIVLAVGYFAVPKILDFLPKEEKIIGQPAPSETIIKSIPLPDIESLRTT